VVSLRILFVSNLFPNSFDPSRGLFSINQLLALRELGCEFKVIAPVASFPLRRSPWAEEAGRLPSRETYADFDVYHPKAWYLPLNRGPLNADLFRWSIRRTVDRLCAEHRPEVLWGSFAFPDGVAVAGIARRRGLPLVVSLLGSDINLNLKYSGRRKVILHSLKQASLVLAKSRALKDIVVSLGVPAETVALDYNGVDQETFRPSAREPACRECGVDPSRRRILFVGNFVDVKNIPTLIRAFAAVVADAGDPVDLVLVGDGPLKAELVALAESLGVRDRVILPGSLTHRRVSTWMAASDLLCLPSKNEGVPNVVLEGLASGLPVVASDVGGIPEVHPGTPAGALFDPTRVEDLSEKLREVLNKDWDASALTAHARAFTWQQNAAKVWDALERIVGGRARSG
jgi:glycosyltransferase involved in cell wall biosynthesis